MIGAGRRLLAVLVAVFLIAAGVRFGFWAEIRGTALDRWQRFDQSDMATYVEQARRIDAGDLLQREPYHPYHSWQFVAPAAKWLEWYAPHSFHQAPAYSYLLALAMPPVEQDFTAVKVIQLLLGAGTCALLAALAAHLAGLGAGVAAGLLAAVYGPLVFLEPQLLREGPALCCIFAIVLALCRHLEREQGTPRRTIVAALALGAAAGAFSMLHEMGSVVTLAVVIALAARELRQGWKRALLACGCAAAGWLVGFAPLLARNVAVGAPALSVSCRTVTNFVEANVADAPDGGATFTPPSATAMRILDESRGRGGPAFAGVVRSYGGDVGLALANLRAKLVANFIPWEVPDNTSYEFFREHSAVLAAAPTFAFLFPLGFAGLAASVWTLARRPAKARELTKKQQKQLAKRGEAAEEPEPAPLVPSARERIASHLALFLLLVGLAAALSLVHTVARFRMYLVPIFVVYAGVLLAALWRALREQRGPRVLALAALVVAGFALQRAVPTDDFVRGLRSMDYALAAELSAQGGDVAGAIRFGEESLAAFPADAGAFANAGLALERRGDRAAAAELFRRALAVDPVEQRARAGLQRVQQ